MAVDVVHFKFADAEPAGFVLYSSLDSSIVPSTVLDVEEGVPLSLNSRN